MIAEIASTTGRGRRGNKEVMSSTMPGNGSSLPFDDEDVYQACLAHGPTTPADLVGHVARPRTEIDQAIERLHRAGLLSGVDGEIWALPPRMPLHALAHDLEAAASKARERARTWDERWRQTQQTSYLELVDSDAAAMRVQANLLEMAEHEIRALSIGPAGPAQDRPATKVIPGFFETLERGVRFRVVYGVSVFQNENGLRVVQQCVRAGEEARVFPDVPLNLILCDDRQGVLTVPGNAKHRRHAVIVHPSGLLDALIGLFESYWRMAGPLYTDQNPIAEEAGPSGNDRQLLTYLSAGLTDASIARELAVSERTIGRRISRLQQLLGANSRFQLGSQATRRGWI